MMAQVWTTKQQNFMSRFTVAVVNMLTASDALTALCTEFTDDFYGTGGANALTDAVVQTVIPAATAAQTASAEGAVVNVLATVQTNRGYLEMMRP
jgi:hypothetical protein